jgi:creatinine amidohydrolase
MSELFEMSWEEVRDLDRANAIVILPVGAVEAHGPHLPLATDVIISEAMAGAGAKRLVAAGHCVVMLPSLSYTAAGFAADFPGTISLSPETVTSLLVDVAESLTGQGFATLALANSHLDPAHLESLHATVNACREREILRVVFPDLTRKPWVLRLTDEFKSGACHAGQFETSIVMAARPELVRDSIRRELTPNPSSLSAAIRAGKKTFEDANGERAYFGYPAQATVEEGARTIDELGSILADAVLEELSSA